MYIDVFLFLSLVIQTYIFLSIKIKYDIKKFIIFINSFELNIIDTDLRNNFFIFIKKII